MDTLFGTGIMCIPFRRVVLAAAACVVCRVSLFLYRVARTVQARHLQRNVLLQFALPHVLPEAGPDVGARVGDAAPGLFRSCRQTGIRSQREGYFL